jgi:hypothetical protein
MIRILAFSKSKTRFNLSPVSIKISFENILSNQLDSTIDIYKIDLFSVVRMPYPRLLEIGGYAMSAVSGSWLGMTSFEDKSN